jgi:hypothetical protein
MAVVLDVPFLAVFNFLLSFFLSFCARVFMVVSACVYVYVCVQVRTFAVHAGFLIVLDHCA